jgi:hypothetical protein
VSYCWSGHPLGIWITTPGVKCCLEIQLGRSFSTEVVERGGGSSERAIGPEVGSLAPSVVVPKLLVTTMLGAKLESARPPAGRLGATDSMGRGRGRRKKATEEQKKHHRMKDSLLESQSFNGPLLPPLFLLYRTAPTLPR